VSASSSSRTFQREERPQPQKRKRDASPPAHDDDDQSEDDTEERKKKAVKVPKVTIEKGSGFRTKVSSNAVTPLARLLASQNKPSTSSDDEDEPNITAESSKKRKTTNKSTKTDPEKAVDPSIMGSKYASAGGGGTGKKSQAELDEDAEIAWLEYQLRKGKGKGGKGGEEDGLEDDGLDGKSSLSFFSHLFWRVYACMEETRSTVTMCACICVVKNKAC
jgi:hypothetical protein